jgi:DNA-binding MarR family transcriptional regulator
MEYGLHESLGYWVARLSSAMGESFNTAIAQYDVTAAQWSVLITLYRDRARTPLEIAQFIGIDGSAVTRLLDRLEKRGLTRRKPNPEDRRSLVIELTSEGRKLTPKLAAISRDLNRKFLDRLTPAEVSHFERAIRKMAKDTVISLK